MKPTARYVWLFSALAAAVVLTVLLLVGIFRWGFFGTAVPRPTSSAASTVTSAGTLAVSRASGKYVLGEWEGRLALFTAGDDVPTEVYDVYIAALPEEEQVRLKQGVPVADAVELARLLEDYTS